MAFQKEANLGEEDCAQDLAKGCLDSCNWNLHDALVAGSNQKFGADAAMTDCDVNSGLA